MRIADITGTWKVKITATGGTQVPLGSEWTAFIKASQTGTIVSGIFTTEHGVSGQIAGNVLGDEVSMRIDQGPDCPGTFHGVAKVHASTNEMAGTYSGADTSGNLEASFIAYRMKYYAAALNRIKTKISSTVFSSEEKKLLMLRLVLPGLIGSIILILAIIFSVHLMERIIPNFRAYLYLAFALIFGLYGLYKLFKKR